MRKAKSHNATRPRTLHWISACLAIIAAVILGVLLLTEYEVAHSGLVASLVAPLVLAALILALVTISAYRRERHRERSSRPPIVAGRASGSLSAATPHGVHATANSNVAAVVTLGIGEHSPGKLPVPVLPPAAIKVCTECGREYQTALRTCPFDHSPLRPKSPADSAPRREDYLDTRRTLMRCDSCQREYDIGARFCLHDGDSLSVVEQEDGGGYFDGDMDCPECGLSYEPESNYCPEDGARLVPKTLGRSHAAFGSIPLVICPKCMQEFQPTLTHCPSDGSELLPLVGRTTGGNPTTGFGPKSNICPKCGVRYGAEARFCGADGTRLTQLN